MALRPATGDDGAGSAAAPAPGESLAELRANRLRRQCQFMRMRLVDRRAKLLDADEAGSAMKRHAGVVRGRVGQVPARAAARFAARYAVGEEGRTGLEAILAREMGLVLAELRDDPLAVAPLLPPESISMSP